MPGRAYTNIQTTGKGLIKGVPSVVEWAEELERSYLSILDENMQQSIKEIQEGLRERSGVDFEVTHDGNEVHFWAPNPDEVLAAEYGGPTTPPAPHIRKLLAKGLPL